MCSKGRDAEHGIKALDGFGSELRAALLGVQHGLEVDILNRDSDETKVRLTEGLGARFIEGEIDDIDGGYDVIMECTGSCTVAMRSIERAAPNGIVCLLSVSSAGEELEIDAGKTNFDIVVGRSNTGPSMDSRWRTRNSTWLCGIPAWKPASIWWYSREGSTRPFTCGCPAAGSA